MADRLTPDAPAPKSNLTPESFLEQYTEWRKAKRAQGSASSDVMNIKKKMKGIGVDMRAFDLMEKLNDMDTDEAVEVMKTVVRYGTWAGMPFATQQDLFKGLAIEKPQQDAAEVYRAERAYDDGWVAGADKKSSTANPHLQGTEEHANWVRGFMESKARQESLKAKGSVQPDAPRRGRPPKQKTTAAPANDAAAPPPAPTDTSETREDDIDAAVGGGASMLH